MLFVTIENINRKKSMGNRWDILKRKSILFIVIIMIISLFNIGDSFFHGVQPVEASSVEKASGKYEVTAKSLNVRTGASTTYKKVGSLKKGTVITVNGKKGNWYRFNYKGKNRYVSGKYLKKHTTSSVAVVKNMKKLNKNNKQVILVTTKGYNTYHAKIQTFEKDSKGNWKRKLNVKGYI